MDEKLLETFEFGERGKWWMRAYMLPGGDIAIDRLSSPDMGAWIRVMILPGRYQVLPTSEYLTGERATFVVDDE